MKIELIEDKIKKGKTLLKYNFRFSKETNIKYEKFFLINEINKINDNYFGKTFERNIKFIISKLNIKNEKLNISDNNLLKN